MAAVRGVAQTKPEALYVRTVESQRGSADPRRAPARAQPRLEEIVDVGYFRIELRRAGRYMAETDLSMSGEWKLKLDWNGPAGRGTAAFDVTLD